MTRTKIPIDAIRISAFNPRIHEFLDQGYIRELAISIQRDGQIEPVVVRKLKNDSGSDNDLFELIVGSCRFLACRQLGYETIDATIRELSDEQCADIALAENINRHALSPYEEARAIKALMERFNRTVPQQAVILGLSPRQLYTILYVLDDDMPEVIRHDLMRVRTTSTQPVNAGTLGKRRRREADRPSREEKRITPEHYQYLRKMKDRSLQISLARRVQKEHMTVARLREIVNNLRKTQISQNTDHQHEQKKLRAGSLEHIGQGDNSTPRTVKYYYTLHRLINDLDSTLRNYPLSTLSAQEHQDLRTVLDTLIAKLI